LRRFRKTDSVEASVEAEVTSGGRLFQRRHPATGNARPPTVDNITPETRRPDNAVNYVRVLDAISRLFESVLLANYGNVLQSHIVIIKVKVKVSV